MTGHGDQLNGKGVGPVPVDAASHLPPQDLEAEEAILGAMMLSLEAIGKAEEVGLKRDQFYRASHRMIYDAIMHTRDAGKLDELMVIRRLEAMPGGTVKELGPDGKAMQVPQSALRAAGGASSVLSLTERVPAVANAKAYAQQVVGYAVKRGLVETGHAVADLGYRNDVEPAAALRRAEERLLQLVVDQGAQHERGDEHDTADSMDAWAAAYERRKDLELYQQDTVSWGTDELDTRLGRMAKGAVYVPAGWTKHGKTWWVLDVLEAVMEQGHRVLLDSGEMSDTEITDRWVAMGGHDYTKVQEGLLPWGVMAKRRKQMSTWNRRVTTGRMSVQRLRAQVSRAKLEGRPYRVVAVDHLGLVRGEGRQSRNQFLEDVCAELKSMAEEYGFTLILVSQLSRPAPEKGKHPRYLRPPIQSDLKDASGIEQIATAVIFVYRHMNADPSGQGGFVGEDASLLFPFHRLRPTPKRLSCEFVIRGDAERYRFRAKDYAATATPVVVAVQESLTAQFGPGVTLVDDRDDDIPF